MKRIVIFFLLVLLVCTYTPQLNVFTLKTTESGENWQIGVHSEAGNHLCSSNEPIFLEIPGEMALSTPAHVASAQLSENRGDAFSLGDSQVSQSVSDSVPALTSLNDNEREHGPAVMVNNGSSVEPLWGEYHAGVNYLECYFTRAYAYEQDTCYITVGVHNFDAGFFGADLYICYMFYSPNTTYVGFQTSAKHYVYRGTDYTFPTLEIPIGSFFLRHTGPESRSKVVPELWWDDSGNQRLQDDGWSVNFPVLDEDTHGPDIYNVQTTEYNGDNDGVFEDDEQVKISWSLNDPSGIYETKCSVDGSWQSVQGNYYVVCGPFVPGNHLYKIYATDNDNDLYHDGDRSSSDTGPSPLSFNVADDDTQGPVIQSVQVSEHNGNGDGIIRNNEQVKISWSLSDPSEIYSRSCKVDGTSYSVQDSYYTICGPLGAGIHSYEILATDNDDDRSNDHSSSSDSGSFEVYKLRELGVTHKVQRKDTYLLSVGCGTSGEVYSGQLAWDRPHPTTLVHETGSVLDDNYCARASVSMIVSYFGGSLSQDRISYYYFEERPGVGDDLPEGDLGEGSGMWGQYVLGWALSGASIEPHSGKPAFSEIRQWIDANRPIYISYKWYDEGVEKRHAMVIDGYDTHGDKVHILDPWEIAGSGWDKVWLSYSLFETVYGTLENAWITAAGAVGRNDEPTVWADSDGDGVYDFDEINRFHTDPDRVDTDGDGVSDKQEIVSYTFQPNQSYDSSDQRKPDPDNDGLRAEVDQDSDDGGVHDGLEDMNGNGFCEPALGETDPLNSSDDPNTIHLESKQDNTASANLGTLTFGGAQYSSLPQDITRTAGTYLVEYRADPGYPFDRWETTFGISVADSTNARTLATVDGSGTLRAIYKLDSRAYCIRFESRQHTNASFSLGFISLDGIDYSLPSDVAEFAGDYSVEYSAPDGYSFYRWEVLGSLDAANQHSMTTTVTVRGNGTITAVYKKTVHGYSIVATSAWLGSCAMETGTLPVGVVIIIALGAYWDSQCSEPVEEIDWGLIQAGSNESVALFLRNEGNVENRLSFIACEWHPSEAESYVSLTCDYDGGGLHPNEVAEIHFILSVSENVNGFDQFAFTIDIALDMRPIAALSVSKTVVNVGEDVTFDATGSIDDGNVTNYFFVFGDGSDSGWTFSPRITHNYNSVGFYNATLIVMDNHGIISATSEQTTLQVTASPPVGGSSYSLERIGEETLKHRYLVVMYVATVLILIAVFTAPRPHKYLRSHNHRGKLRQDLVAFPFVIINTCT